MDHQILLDLSVINESFAEISQKAVAKKNPEKKVEVLQVLDPKPSKNVEILLQSLRLPLEVLCRAILEFDEKILSRDQVISLRAHLPLPEEVSSSLTLADC